MDAKTYNDIRKSIFSTVHEPEKGFDVAHYYLDGMYKRKLSVTSYAGMKAELSFYERHHKDFELTVAGDTGEHADFSGVYEGRRTRFDVTTNVAVRDFINFEPYVGNGVGYKIALLDKKSFDVLDVFDLAFNRCKCGGNLIPFVAILGRNYNRQSNSLRNNDQISLHICSGCKEFFEVDRFCKSIRSSPQEYYNELCIIEDNDVERHRLYDEYCVENYKYLRHAYQENLMGIAEPAYVNPEGKRVGGFWALKFAFLNSAIRSDFLMPIYLGDPMK